MAELTIHPLTSARIDDYMRFFDTRAFTDNADWSRCYCFYPYCDAKTREWETRGASENRASMCDLIVDGQAQGYLAYVDREVVGWCNAGPYASFPILNRLLDVAPRSTGAIVCFVVCPEHRGQGIAKTLLGAACDGLKMQGMQSVIAKPSRDATSTAENYPGPLAMYIAAGFTPIHEDGQGSVIVRKEM